MIELANLRDEFLSAYGTQGRVFGAPGRVNLIGEHTDYNDGFVLPMAIERHTVVVAQRRSDRIVQVRSKSMPDVESFDLDHPRQRQRGTWLDYVEGTAQELRKSGVELVGADLLIDSDVPRGAGLSSSAALEMSTGFAFASLAGQTQIDRTKLALAGQSAEHHWVGTLCGIMDQFISASAKPGHALLIDCRSLEARPVPLDLRNAAVVICDTKVHHELATSEYNRRREECQTGVALLRPKLGQIQALRDVSISDLETHSGELPAPVLARCRHVVSENARTLEAAKVLEAGDLEAFGQLMYGSHVSLRDDYEVSCKELDCLVEIARDQAGVFGARMTGGGFGGCTVNLVANDSIEGFCEKIRREYYRAHSKQADLFVSRAASGVQELS